MIPTDLDATLTTDATAAALTASNFPISSATLSAKRCRGGGPPFSVFSGRPRYVFRDALAWARGQTAARNRNDSRIK